MIGLENQPFLDISQCMADLGCLPTYPDDGTCLAEDADALQVASSVELLGDITSSLPILRGKVKVGFVSYILRVPLLCLGNMAQDSRAGSRWYISGTIR